MLQGKASNPGVFRQQEKDAGGDQEVVVYLGSSWEKSESKYDEEYKCKQ